MSPAARSLKPVAPFLRRRRYNPAHPRRAVMRTARLVPVVLGVLGLAVAATMLTGVSARQANSDAVAIDGDDIGGVVTGPRGPEAGVWVIAETTDLPTKFVRIVVTDDRGRYLVPDLPK